MSKDWKKALEAVSQLTDQKELANVAQYAENVRLRKLAVEKLSDPKILTALAKNGRGGWIDSNSDVRKKAVEKLSDFAVLSDIANSRDCDRYVCKWMTGNGMALTAKTIDLRDVARERLRELRKKTLEDVERVTNQALLADIAQNAEHSDVRLIAADKLDDKALAQEVYASVAKNEVGAYLRKEAIERLTDPNALADVARNATHGGSRLMAADKLDDKALAQEVYAHVAKNSEDQDMRMAAVKRLTDPETLTDIAQNALYSDVRLEAADRLGDKALAQKVYADVAQRGK